MNTFIDLFAGIGGFRVALEERGLNCVFSSEIDVHAREAYKKNFGDYPGGDITEISEHNIPKHDVLCAGFPCQPFSISGKHGGVGDPRGKLFYDITRIARYHRPHVLLLENVKNILSIDDGNVITGFYKKLHEIGYRVEHSLLNASHFGIPQKRERVYIVCIRRELSSIAYKKPGETMEKVSLREILIRDSLCRDLVINRDDIQLDLSKDRESLSPVRIGIVNKGGQGERIYSTKGHAITLSANGGGVGARTGLYYVNGIIRRLHIDECKALMGFSQKHHVSDGIQGYKQLGNAIIVPMAQRIYDGLTVA